MFKATLRSWPVWLVMFVIFEAVCSVTPASAVHVLSVYADVDTDDSTFYAWVNGGDNEPDFDCGTEAYETGAILNGPTGSTGGWIGGFTNSVSLPFAEGDFTVYSGITVFCGCAGQIMVDDVMPVNTSRFRAVFQKRGPNGSQIEYGAVCIHSCQPRRVCIPHDAPWATFEGRKVVTPAVSRCQMSTPVLPTTERPACMGTGVGLWNSFTDNCQF